MWIEEGAREKVWDRVEIRKELISGCWWEEERGGREGERIGEKREKVSDGIE